MRLKGIGLVELVEAGSTFRFNVSYHQSVPDGVWETWCFDDIVTLADIGVDGGLVVVRRFSKVDHPDFAQRLDDDLFGAEGVAEPRSGFFPERFLHALRRIVDEERASSIMLSIDPHQGGRQKGSVGELLLILSENVDDVVGYTQAFVRRLNRYMAEYNKANPSS